VVPRLIDTRDLPTPKWRAMSATSSRFALPSTGAALTRATQLPSCAVSSELAREFGLTLTWSDFNESPRQTFCIDVMDNIYFVVTGCSFSQSLGSRKTS